MAGVQNFVFAEKRSKFTSPPSTAGSAPYYLVAVALKNV